MSTLRNSVRLSGHVGKDPDIKYLPTGAVVANFSLATQDDFKDRNGTWTKRTNWHNITCWGELAKRVETHVHKGSNISIDGKLFTESWTDNDNQKRQKVYIQMSEFLTHNGPRKQDDNDLSQM